MTLSAGNRVSELVTAPLWAVAMDLAPYHAGTSSGVMNTGLGLAAIVSPPLVGWLIDRTGSWHAVFALSTFFLLLGPIAAIWTRPDKPYLGEPSVEGPDGLGLPADA